MPKKTRKKTGNTLSTAKSGRTLRKTPAKAPVGKTDAAKATAAKKRAGKAAAKPSQSVQTLDRRSTTVAPRPPSKVIAGKQPEKKTTRGTPDHAVGALDIGDPAPSFLLPRDGGQSVSLADYAGRKLVIFFYPRADTPGCTLEAMDFSRLADAFAASQTAVLGVSADPVKAQDKFRDKHNLTVPLASDEEHRMLERFGVWGEKSMYGRVFLGVLRTTVLIDASGMIARIWHNVRVPGHAEEVLAAARGL